PRIRARLAATAGFLLAAEGAADLGAGGADVDVGDAAVAAGGREEGLGGLQVLGEDGRAQALRHVVLHLDGLLQLAVLHHVQDRREGFLLNDGVAVLQAGDDGRQYVEAGPVQGGAAGLDLAAGGPGLLDRRQVGLHRVAAVERAHQVLRVGRVADLLPALRVGRDQLLQHAVVAGFVHEQAAGAGAALAGGADGAEDDGRDGQLQVGAGVDDDGVVAAQLQQRAAHAPGHALADEAADPGRAGEADQRDALVVDERLGQVAAGVVEQEEDVREAAGAQGFVADLHGGDRRQRRLGRGLPDADVAADGGDEGIPGPDRDREVEG